MSQPTDTSMLFPEPSVDYDRHGLRPRSSGSRPSSRGQETESNNPEGIPHEPFPPKQRPWNKRPRSPGLKWYKDYDTIKKCRSGRVLLIDYVRQDHSKEGMRKVAAQEIDSIEGLRKIYTNPDRCGEAVLRLFHVQNASWATHFLLRKFNINAHDDLVGTDFGRYVKYQRPENRGRKPLLTAKSWKTTHDPWRGISRTSFGLDYLKPYRANSTTDRPHHEMNGKMMELNHYDDEDNACYGWDIYVQRTSCYVQHKETFAEIPSSPEIKNPYSSRVAGRGTHQYVPNLESLDNENTIIIFEDSQTGSIDDTLIAARQQWESRWRRLPFYLALESHDVSNDDRLAVECMKIILQDIWKGVADAWDCFFEVSNSHISILEDKIYEEPADETRAPELWTNASCWLKVERLAGLHTNVVKEMQINLRDLTAEPAIEDNWLESSPNDMERVEKLVQEDLVKPTTNLADLMYKSVGIRDSRHSLQLSTSMWRLSWITFIFLPLTFLVGFFGMHVDLFASDISIKWYFVAAAPMMTFVLILWYMIKHFLTRNKTPYYRGIYENMFHEMATAYPLLWSRSGPRETVKPQKFLARLKWRLILHWNRAKKTIQAGRSSADVDYDDLGAWSHIKRILTHRWTSQIRQTENVELSEPIASFQGATGDETQNSHGEITELFALPGQEYSENLPGGMMKAAVLQSPWSKRLSTSSDPASAGRPSSKGSSAGRNSGVMVEEERPNWLQELGAKGFHLSDWMGLSAAAKNESSDEHLRPSPVRTALKDGDVPEISIVDGPPA